MGSDFNQLKTDLLYHDAMKGCFEYNVSTELYYWLEDKQKNIDEAHREFEESVRVVQESATMPQRQKWNALRVPSFTQLELEPRFLVGSPYYELPDKADREGMFTLLNRIQELAQDIPAHEEGSLAALQRVMDEMENLEWSKQDIQSLVTALTAKVDLMQVLASLMKEMQETQWNMSRAEAKKEELQRKEEHGYSEGEVDLAFSFIYDRLQLHDDLFRLCEAKLVNIDIGIDKCLHQRNSQVNQWKQGAASIEVLREAKQRKRTACKEDLAKLERAIEYEARQAQLAKEKFDAELKTNDSELMDIVHTVKNHVEVQRKLAEQWKAEEEQIKRHIQQRQSVVGARLQLIMNEAQRQADFQEFLECCGNHEKYLHGTDSMCTQADEALKFLQQFTTGSSRFLDQDFHQTKNQLSEMKLNTLKQIIHAHKDAYGDITKLINKKQYIKKNLAEKMENAASQAEVCKETFNPLAKKFVMEVTQLSAEHDEVVNKMEWLDARLAGIEEKYEKTVKQLEEFSVSVQHPKEKYEWMQEMRQEKLLDYHDTLLETTEDQILNERDLLKLQESKAKEEQHIRKQARVAMRYENTSNWTIVDGVGDVIEQTSDNIDVVNRLNRSLQQGGKKERRETRPIASYSSSGAVSPGSPTHSSPKRKTNTTSTAVQRTAPLGGEQSELAFSLGATRASPLDLARNRRAEPRTIAGPN